MSEDKSKSQTGPWLRMVFSSLIGGSVPIALLFIAGLVYWLLGDIAKGIGIQVPANLALIARAFGLVGIMGTFIGLLIGFILARKQLGYIQQYMFLVILGSAVPVVGSLLQYGLYKANPSQFSIDEKIQNALGRANSLAKQTEIAKQIAQLNSVTGTLRSVVSAMAGKVSVTYLDPLSSWNPLTGCRRMNLGDLSDRFCIERQTAYTKLGKMLNYMPVVHVSGEPDYVIDSLLLTGRYHCAAEQDIFGAGGLTLLKNETVSADYIRVCFGVAADALDAQITSLSNQKKLFDSAAIMPYWYFLASCLYAFVGAGSFAIQPLGIWPTFVDASLVVFRFVYLGTLVNIWLDSVRSKSPDKSADGT